MKKCQNVHLVYGTKDPNQQSYELETLPITTGQGDPPDVDICCNSLCEKAFIVRPPSIHDVHIPTNDLCAFEVIGIGWSKNVCGLRLGSSF